MSIGPSPIKIRDQRRLPGVLEVRNPSRHINDVDRAFADNLKSDVDVAAFCIMSFGVRFRSLAHVCRRRRWQDYCFSRRAVETLGWIFTARIDADERRAILKTVVQGFVVITSFAARTKSHRVA